MTQSKGITEKSLIKRLFTTMWAVLETTEIMRKLDGLILFPLPEGARGGAGTRTYKIL